MKDNTRSNDEAAMSQLRDERSKSYSPGPYAASQGAEDDPERWTIVANNGTKPWLIATVENGQPGDTCETEKHTANLLAAAPELCEALKELLECPRSGMDHQGMEGRETRIHCPLEAFQKAQAALRLAKEGRAA